MPSDNLDWQDVLSQPITEDGLKGVYLLFLNRLPGSEDLAQRPPNPLGDEFARVARSSEVRKLAQIAQAGGTIVLHKHYLSHVRPLLIRLFGQMPAEMMLRTTEWDAIAASALVFTPPGRPPLLGVLTARPDMSGWVAFGRKFASEASLSPSIFLGRLNGIAPALLVETLVGQQSAEESARAEPIEQIAADILASPAFHAAVIAPGLAGAALRHETLGRDFGPPQRAILAALAQTDLTQATDWRSAFAAFLDAPEIPRVIAARTPANLRNRTRMDVIYASKALRGEAIPSRVTQASMDTWGRLVGDFTLGSDTALNDVVLHITTPAQPDLSIDLPVRDVTRGSPLLCAQLPDAFTAVADAAPPNNILTLLCVGPNGPLGPSSPVIWQAPKALSESVLTRARWLFDQGRPRAALSHLAPYEEDLTLCGEAGALRYRIELRTSDFATAHQELVAYSTRFWMSPSCWSLRACAAMRDGQIGTALAAYQQAVALGMPVSPAQTIAQALEPVFAPDSDVGLLESARTAGFDPVQTALLLLAADAFMGRTARSLLSYSARLNDEQRTSFLISAVSLLVEWFYPADRLAILVEQVIRSARISLDALNSALSKQGMGGEFLFASCRIDPQLHTSVPAMTAALTLLHQTDRKRNGVGLATRLLSKTEKEQPVSLLLMIAESQRAAGHFKEASQTLQAALKAGASNPAVLEQFVRLERQVATLDPLHGLAPLEAALNALRRQRVAALMAKPRDVDATLGLARVLELGQDPLAARMMLDDLVARDPDNLLLRVTRLRLNEVMDDAEHMLEDLDIIIPQNPDPKFALSRVKALRKLGMFDGAADTLQAYLPSGNSKIAAEYVRNSFFEARFEDAIRKGREQLATYPDNLELHLYVCAACIEMRSFEEAEYHLRKLEALGGAEKFGLDLPMMSYAIQFGRNDRGEALRSLNALFARMGCQSIEIDTSRSRPVFDSFQGVGPRPASLDGPPPVFDGPLVSVIMTAFNMENYIETAVRSILDQSYTNIELIVVDDRSTDRTPEILRRLEAQNPRVRVVLKTTNDGTYVCKNIGLLHAHGEFIALQDSDDWSHPDRIAKSVAVLMAHPGIVGLTTDWLRMTTDGDMVIKAGGQIVHVSCISLVFRRKQVMDRIGFFDSVRIEADMEYIRRMTRIFGAPAVPRLRWPLLFGRSHSASLTASEEFGLTRTGYTEPRVRYQAAYKAWHKTIEPNSKAVMPFPLDSRIYEAPTIMLP